MKKREILLSYPPLGESITTYFSIVPINYIPFGTYKLVVSKRVVSTNVQDFEQNIDEIIYQNEHKIGGEDKKWGNSRLGCV